MHRNGQGYRDATRSRAASLLNSAALALLLVALAPAALADRGVDPAAVQTSVTGFTGPFQRAELSSLVAAHIVRHLAEEGQPVAKGDLLVELDDGVQNARTEIARLDAESTIAADLARVRLQHARTNYDRLRDLEGGSLTSVKEVEDALATLDAARLEYALAQFNHERAERDYALQKRQLEQLRIYAPFDGYITEHLKQAGETVEERESVLVLVRLDPLLITVDCPLELFGTFAVGDGFVITPTDKRWSPRRGTVRFINPVADAASQTFKVKLLVSNPDNAWAAGMPVVVDFAKKQAADAVSSADAGSRPVSPVISRADQRSRHNSRED